jgi:hypothetical protein
MIAPLIWDVIYGTGVIKFVSVVPKDGIRTKRKNALKYLIYANKSIRLVNALLVITAIV